MDTSFECIMHEFWKNCIMHEFWRRLREEEETLVRKNENDEKKTTRPVNSLRHF